ncbi:hypothetical protein HJG60_010216 [Phyllostomus discolor]|uniref:Uncharacterized protein n=1 Tax=Phyllostomus discolor TaxID=89673 RepID=A0A834EGA1_9CHIR|nr:hypothetical protein HJG60_010216 [Phyllostomus discolor]
MAAGRARQAAPSLSQSAVLINVTVFSPRGTFAPPFPTQAGRVLGSSPELTPSTPSLPPPRSRRCHGNRRPLHARRELTDLALSEARAPPPPPPHPTWTAITNRRLTYSTWVMRPTETGPRGRAGSGVPGVTATPRSPWLALGLRAPRGDGESLGAPGSWVIVGIVVPRPLGLAALAGGLGRENYKAQRHLRLEGTGKLSADREGE